MTYFTEPFYTVPSIQEDHARHVILNQFVACIKCTNDWVVPLDDSEAWVDIAAIVDVLIGSCIWSPTYGSFLITAYDKQAQKIKVRRREYVGTAVAGTPVPSGTKFIFTSEDLSILDGTENGQLPIVTDADNGIVQFSFVGSDSLEDDSVITSKILDEAVTNPKLVDAGVGTSFTVTMIGSDLSSQDFVGTYWTLGPWIKGRISGSGVVISGPLARVDFALPVPPLTTGGYQRYPVTVNVIPASNSMKLAYTEVSVDGLNKRLIHELQTGLATTASYTVDFWFEYPFR